MINSHLPDIVCVQEMWLDNSSESFLLEGYEIISRRDRITDTYGGGVITFVRTGMTNVMDLGKSEQDERCYSVIHSNLGSILLINWYRAPGSGSSSIESLRSEYEEKAKDCIATEAKLIQK